MVLALPTLLKEMRKQFSIKSSYRINTAVKSNLKQIKKICNDEYYNQRFYGNAALNRQILLDKRIADLLTPDTIIAILALHAKTTTLDSKNLIAVKRNSSGLTSFAAVLFYGLNEGLDIIRLMPNNAKNYGPDEYQKQKEQFTQNTLRIVDAIEQAATAMHINPADSKFQKKAEPERTLLKLYDCVLDAIGQVEDKKLQNELLAVPGYSTDEIRNQSFSGFMAICRVLKIKYNLNPLGELVLDDSITLNQFIEQFLSSDTALLNGDVIHLFYDRVHLEACIEQDFKVIIQGKIHYMSTILREMVKQCDINKFRFNTAKEQFAARLKLCERHLQDNFPDCCGLAPENEKLVTKNNDDSLGLIEIKNLILELENTIEQSLWSCTDLSKEYLERDFLRKMVFIYENSKRKTPLKMCLTLAKWYDREGYNYVLAKRGLQFFFNLLSDKTDQPLTQGPRIKNKATWALEEIIYGCLETNKQIACQTNALNELELSIEGKHYNLTQILLHNPNLEQISLTDSQLQVYEEQNDRRFTGDSTSSVLTKAEQIAINKYTSNLGYDIQDFLRHNAKGYQNYKNSNQFIIENLLCAVVATHGLNKTPRDLVQKHSRPFKNYRKEIGSSRHVFFQSRLNALRSKKPLFEKGFTSTSSKNTYPLPNATIFTIVIEDDSAHKLGMNVSQQSRYEHEHEVTYRPGTQFLYTDHYENERGHFFAVRPVRSIDGTGEDTFTKRNQAEHELKIIAKLFETHLINNRHSALRSLFDTVDNKKKLQCVLSPKNILTQLYSSVKPGTMLSVSELNLCKAAIQNGIEVNKRLIEQSFWPASLGQTGKTLQEALTRINRVILLSQEEKQLQEMCIRSEEATDSAIASLA